MWLSKDLVSLVEISKDTVDALRSEVAEARAELAVLRQQAVTDRITLDWMRVKINSLELERAALLQKAHGISVPTPQLVRQTPPIDPNTASFGLDDMGDDMAKKLGLPLHEIFKHQGDEP